MINDNFWDGIDRKPTAYLLHQRIQWHRSNEKLIIHWELLIFRRPPPIPCVPFGSLELEQRRLSHHFCFTSRTTLVVISLFIFLFRNGMFSLMFIFIWFLAPFFSVARDFFSRIFCLLHFGKKNFFNFFFSIFHFFSM